MFNTDKCRAWLLVTRQRDRIEGYISMIFADHSDALDGKADHQIRVTSFIAVDGGD